MSPFQIACAVIIPVLFVFVLLFWLVTFTVRRRYHRHILNHRNPVRSLIIDTKSGIVTFFNHNELRKVYTLAYDKFISLIAPEDAKQLKKWITDLLAKDSSRAKDYIEIRIYSYNTHKEFHTILRVTKVDKVKRLLHFDSFLLPNHIKNGKHNPIIDVYKDGVVDYKKISIPSIRGYTIVFNFSFANDSGINSIINRLTFVRIKEVAALCSGSMQKTIFEISDDQFAIIDNKSVDRDQVSEYVHEVTSAIHQFLELNSNLDEVCIAVGVVANSQFPNKPQKLIETACETAQIAKSKNVLMVIYDQRVATDANASESEIEDIIKEHRLTYRYSPIYDVRKSRIYGYVTRVLPVNTNAKNISELYTRALNTNESKKLVTCVTKESINCVVVQNHNEIINLFLEIKFADYTNYLSTLSRIKLPSNIRPVLIFDESDIVYFLKSKTSFKESIKKINESGVSTCLKLSDKTLVFDNTIYDLFDQYIVNLNFERFNKTGSANLDFRIIVEKLLKYNRPIILNHVESWAAVELLVRSGIEYIISDAIIETSEKLLELNRKTVIKIKKMLE